MDNEPSNCSNSRKLSIGRWPSWYSDWMRCMNCLTSLPILPTYSLRQGKKRWKQRLNWDIAPEKAWTEYEIRLYMQYAPFLPPSSSPSPYSLQSSAVLASRMAANLSRYCLYGVTNCLLMYCSKFPMEVAVGSLLMLSIARSMIAGESFSWRRACWKASHFKPMYMLLPAEAVVYRSMREASRFRSGLSCAGRQRQKSSRYLGLRCNVNSELLLRKATSSYRRAKLRASIYRQTLYYT